MNLFMRRTAFEQGGGTAQVSKGSEGSEGSEGSKGGKPEEASGGKQ